jgi:2-polyprenyl-6-methoxyphenol hydroxylase-like FAD-dependent oxidoreductase
VQVVVIGAGVAGLGASLALARRGHTVTVLERDPHAPPADPREAFDEWKRPGVPHFRLPHLFLALARVLLEREFPDVLDALQAAGASDVPLRDRVPGGPTAADADLVALTCRRPLFEWGLRRAAEAAPAITLRTGVRVEGLVASGDRITGVRTNESGAIGADLVVDASGRGSRVGAWLTDQALSEPSEESDPCGVIYHSRHFERDAGFEYPTRQGLFGPRGDLGYMSFATFPGEDRSWCLALSVPPYDDELRAIRRAPAFMAAARAIPSIVELIDASVPTTDVLLMGELHNRTRSFISDKPTVTGLIVIGDALTQTDPSFGWGLSIGLQQAIWLAELVDVHGADLRSLALAFDSEVAAWSATYYRASRDTDRGRTSWWKGEIERDAALAIGGPLFLGAVVPAAARSDPEIFRAFSRRNNLLDPVDRLPSDRALLERAAAMFAEQQRTAAPSPPAGPDRGTMLQRIREAAPA